MSFVIFLVAGFISGVLGGMGMGGGTVLIPVLTIFLGVNQRVAQAANIISFLPMAAIALPQHKRNGYLKTDGVLQIIVPALLSAVASSLLMTVIPAEVLRRLFGLFLIAIAVAQFKGLSVAWQK